MPRPKTYENAAAKMQAYRARNARRRQLTNTAELEAKQLLMHAIKHGIHLDVDFSDLYRTPRWVTERPDDAYLKQLQEAVRRMRRALALPAG